VRDTFTTAQIDDSAISGEAADPDGDAIPLLMEYACAMAIDESSTEGAPVPEFIERDGQLHMAFTFNRRIGTELQFLLQASVDLATWENTGAAVEVLETLDAETGRCRLVDPHPVAQNRFARVLISLP